MLMSMESSQSKNEKEERERGGNEKLPPPTSKKKEKKGCVLGVYRQHVMYVSSVFLEQQHCRV